MPGIRGSCSKGSAQKILHGWKHVLLLVHGGDWSIGITVIRWSGTKGGHMSSETGFTLVKLLQNVVEVSVITRALGL
jgi:hypothetical protein